METYNNLYSKIYDFNNLILAWKRARKHKTKKDYVIEFEANLKENLLKLQEELKTQTYKPKPLRIFILCDPKTRKISKSFFRDRIIHHAIVNVIEPIFDKLFIYDCCANRIGKGNLFALERLDYFKRKVTNNLKSEAFCIKADIKHYFDEVDHEVLISIIKRKITDKKAIWLIRKILDNAANSSGGGRTPVENTLSYYLPRKGMPLGNLTSQFFANVYLNELDYFVKHKLRAKCYVRYVDDFVILHNSKEQLEIWKKEISRFLNEKLKIELHPEKSKITSLSRGVDFVGFRCFWHYKLLRKRNIRKMLFKIKKYKEEEISKEQIIESFQGWNAYARWANSYKLRRSVVKKIYSKKEQ